MENTEAIALDISEDEIRENFKLLTQRPITPRTVSVGKCIANLAQQHVMDFLKLGIMPLRVHDYYLIKAEVLDELIKKMEKTSTGSSKSA